MEAAMSGEGPTARFGTAAAAVAEALDRAQANDVARRLWAADLSLWSQNPLVQNLIADRLGWLRVAEAMRAGVPDLTAWGAEIAQDVDDVVLLGAQGMDLIGACDVARAIGTVPHEILCRIGARIERTYNP